MRQPHPKLDCRPKNAEGLARPTLVHPTLGTLEYLNFDGGWWQGMATVWGQVVCLQMSGGSNLAREDIEAAAKHLHWLQQNEVAVRPFVAKKLHEASYKLLLAKESLPVAIENAAHVANTMRPTRVHLTTDWSDIDFDCEAILGHSIQEMTLEFDRYGKFLSAPKIWIPGPESRARRLLERRLPPDASEFENSPADQFLVTLTNPGKIKFDIDLVNLLDQSIEDVERRERQGSSENRSYMASAKVILEELAKTASIPLPVISQIRATVRFRHSQGKRKPVKDRLVFAPGEPARFEGAARYPLVNLFVISELQFESDPDRDESFRLFLQKQLIYATEWLARQSPSVFQDMRDAGFETDIDFWLLIRAPSDELKICWPLQLLSQCVRLGLEMNMEVANAD